MRVVVDELLDWRGVPIIREHVARHTRSLLPRVPRSLEPLDESRDQRDQITYDNLSVHGKRHYDFAATAACRSTLMAKEFKEFKESLRDNGV